MQSRKKLIITIVLKNVKYETLNYKILLIKNKNKEQDNCDKVYNKTNL